MTVRGFHEHPIATEVIGFRNTILIPSNHLSSSDPTTPFKPCRRRFVINIAFAVTVSRTQGQTLKRDGICPPSPGCFQAQLYVALSRSSSFDNVAVPFI